MMASNTAFKTLGKRDNLNRLHDEILLEIVSWLQTPELPPPDNINEWPREGCCRARPTYDWKNQEHPSLSSLRIVNKRLHGLVTPISSTLLYS